MHQHEGNQDKCGICRIAFCNPACPHSREELAQHVKDRKPVQTKPHHACALSDHEVPESGMEIFTVAMDVIEAADEQGGIDCMDDYLATMRALRLELDARIENAESMMRNR
jgi:hypothetical protein